ncbi:hypothetical protein MMC27_001665 [Xylographa pallens]|nr:hypothetical protein [Xylographa pallens]
MKHEDAKDLTRCQGPRIADPSEAVPESEASSITVGPATIVLNLEPMPVPSLVFHDDQVVNLRNFLAYSQPFTYTITPGFEIHGSYNGKPASFLTYYVRLVPNRSTQPIQLANLAVVFGRSRTEEAINVVAYAPGRPAPKLERTTEFQKKEKVNELSGGGQAYGAHLGARHTSATTTEKDKQYAGLIEAWAVSIPNSIAAQRRTSELSYFKNRPR